MRKEYDFSNSRKNPYTLQLDSIRYLKIVEWSDEDQCFIGQCPGVIGSCCHGDDEITVYTELCTIIDEWLALWKQEGKPLPPPTYGKGIAQKLADVA